MLIKKYGIFVLLSFFILLGGVYSVVTPIMEASDELWHYPMVKYLADHRSLPYQDPAAPETMWRQEGSQAPLYYAVGAALTLWIDTSDLPLARYSNPHADNGIITQDGNSNLMIHGLADAWPWRGATLAIHLIRLASVLMGAGTVYLTYCLLLEIWPGRVGMALAAAAITAFNPMFLFISASVNNGNLGMLLSAAGIWLLARLVRRHAGPQPRATWPRDVVVLGLVLGAAVLTRTNALGLLPLTALAIGYVAWRRRSWRYFFGGGVITAGLVALISGWWFVRNLALYGDLTGIERFIVILGYRDPPATLRQLWGERHGFMIAYWGLFGGVNVPLPGWIYDVLNGLAIAAALGLGLAAARFGWRVWRGGARVWCTPRTMQLLLLLLWPALVLTLWAAWALRTWSSQGRLVFGAISAWSVWLAVGLSRWLAWGRLRRWGGALPGLMGAFMFGVAAWAPFGVIAPAYRPPLLPPGVEPAPQHVLRADVGGQLRLLGYDIENDSTMPGEAFRFKLYWEAQREMDRDWSIFVHVFDLDLGLPVATRDRFPGQGLLATSMMSPGLRWVDEYVVWLPQTAYAPAGAVLEVGLYDRRSGERPPVVVEAGEAGVVGVVENGLRFQPLRIEPRPGAVPNPVRIDFEDRLALVGWALDRRVAAPGEALTLTLYWECLDEMTTAYTVSAQVLDDGGGKVAQWDGWPGETDTSSWVAGQRVVDRRVLRIADDAPAGGYRLLLLLYDGATLKRMRIIDAEGRVLPNDFHVLGQVRVRQ